MAGGGRVGAGWGQGGGRVGAGWGQGGGRVGQGEGEGEAAYSRVGDTQQSGGQGTVGAPPGRLTWYTVLPPITNSLSTVSASGDLEQSASASSKLSASSTPGGRSLQRR